jgi:hypothetical protein
MRSVLAQSVLVLGLMMTMCASAGAAALHRSRSPAHAHQDFILHPRERVAVPRSFAVPGWTDEQTQQWLNNAERGAHEG